MRALERRGMLSHDTVGKAFRYRPAVTRRQYTDASVSKLVGDLFGGRQDKLLCHLLGTDRISRTELQTIRSLICKAEDKKR
jgi:predicted transcriptional regulator